MRIFKKIHTIFIIPDRLIRETMTRTAVSQEQAPTTWLALKKKETEHPPVAQYVPYIRVPRSSSSVYYHKPKLHSATSWRLQYITYFTLTTRGQCKRRQNNQS